MKKYAYIVAALSLALWVASSFASPQIQNQIKVNVPFTFYVGNTQLPAGEYTIRRVSDATPDVLELRSTDGRMAVLVLGRPIQSTSTPSKTELVFKKYGNVPILSQIFQAGNQWGVELPKLLQEEQAAKGGTTPETQSVEGTSSKQKVGPNP
jgi:hypothetical protein